MEQNKFSKIHAICYPVVFLVAFSLGSFYGNGALLQLGFAELMNGPRPQATVPENTTTSSRPSPETHNVSGIVQVIKDTLITIKTSDDMVIVVTADAHTKFQKGVPKDSSTAKSSTSSEPFIRKESSISEIKTGDLITASSDKNIKDATAFIATEVLVLQKPNLAGVSK